MYAIIKTGGKQYKVEKGSPIFVEKLDAKEGDKVTFDEVVLVASRSIKIGTPYVDGASVTGTVEKQGKEKKVVTFKYKPKKNQHTKTGHRQPYTRVMIDEIAGATSSKSADADK
ncbi:MAG: 50S ribosomal protein L21 [Furfurilactobacillus sp.]|uniref:Large ribosomal subunit protein bL21 n=3 Tax=Furfurilactobacillus TaxID=2767882 RepID=A0A0R1RMG8_9LACO|nr:MULTISPECIES: 50S ribosomal protein L21 [Furfurilactobacillus]KRL57342.1 diaminopimelate epimerase [Furfurilactobacillus rossiae DSM 15814]MCF6160564.1 50S ribosomal protein L21 [Furfurilactobacillus milii]MCF6162796.1 50S ribosomal protein L21 [Furfurilactobacillus milii]MCF6164913.1 50S ribosomal protein L21 [Furfurilactobacillus rossiae]MCF6419843.1 50S ribosomal protein L21 [Furfurilactobacillus milii]